MNLLLIDPATDAVEGRRATIRGARVRHVRKVLRKGAGEHLRVGILGGGMGEARIESLTPQAMVVSWSRLYDAPPPKRPLALYLALCRPPMVHRILQAAASFGVPRIVWFASARTEPSYLASRRMKPDAVREALRAGLAQGRDTVLPTVTFLPDVARAAQAVAAEPGRRLLARAGASPCPCGQDCPTAVVVGPEGGFLPDETRAFERAGCVPVGLGPWVLRTEVAVAALLGRLA